MAREFLPTLTKALRKSKNKPMSSAMAKRFMGAGLNTATPGTPYQSNWSTERGITMGMMRSIWAYKAIDSIAKSGCMLPVDIRRGGYDSEDVVDPRTGPRLWNRLNTKASDFEFAIAFKYRLLSQLMLSEAGVFVEYEQDRNGEIQQMFLLNPDTTSPIPDEKTFVSGYQVQSNGQTTVIDKDRVLWIRIPHPTDPYKSFTPLAAAGLSIDLDFYSRLYNRNFMANDGRPGGLVSVKGGMAEDDVELLRRRFNEKGEQGVITVIEAEDVDFQDFSTSPRDAAYGDLRKSVSEEILIAFGVPRSVAGDASGRTYDNADAEENVFWRITMLPLLRFLDMNFGSLTPGGDDDDLWVAHNVMNVQALQRPIRENENRLMEQWREGVLDLDEVRDGLGRDPFGVPGSRTIYVAGGKVGITRNDEDAEAIKELTIVGAPEPEAPVPPPSGPAQTRVGALMKAPGTPIVQNRLQALTTARSPERMAQRAAVEARATAVRREEDRQVASSRTGTKSLQGFEFKGAEHDFNMVALKVPVSHAEHVRRAAPPLPGDVNEAHVTMVLWKGDQDTGLKTIADWAQETAPINVRIGPNLTVFPEGDDGRPLVADVESDSLKDVRKSLRDRLEAAGMEITEHPEYHPHMTLAYLPHGTKNEPDPVSNVAVRHTFEDVYVELMTGDDLHINLNGA